MSLINDMTQQNFDKRDIKLFAREGHSPRDDKDYCFMGMLVDDRENVINILTGEKFHNYSVRYPSIRVKDGQAFYVVAKISYEDNAKNTHYELHTYDENSVINGEQFAKGNKKGTFPTKNMEKVCEYFLGKHKDKYNTNIEEIKEVLQELNEKIHLTMLHHQEIERELEFKRAKYARKSAEGYIK